MTNNIFFLADTSDHILFSLIPSGVPGTEMPTWNQAYGAPFPDEQIHRFVALVRG